MGFTTEEQNRETIARLQSDLIIETGERKQADAALCNWISSERETRIEANNALISRIEAIERAAQIRNFKPPCYCRTHSGIDDFTAGE